MSDLISRQAAIGAIEEVDWYHQNKNKDMVSGANSSEHQAWYKADDIYNTLDALPSTEAIPIDWLKQWEEKHKNDPCYCGFVSEEIIKDWKKENDIDNLLPNCVKHAKVMKEIENQLEDRNGK